MVLDGNCMFFREVWKTQLSCLYYPGLDLDLCKDFIILEVSTIIVYK